MTAIPEPPSRLSDGVVELRAIAEWDIPEILIAHQNDSELHAALGLARPPSGAELGHEVELAERERLGGIGLALTIVEPGGEDCIGRVSVRAHDDPAEPRERLASLTIWLAPEHRGKRLGRGALRLAADWLLGPAGFTRLAIDVPAGNESLRRAGLAAGFTAPAEPDDSARRGGRGELALDRWRLELQR